MYTLIEIMYIISGILLWVLFFITIKEYRKVRLKNLIWLALFFAMIGWLIPLYLIWPINRSNESFLKIIALSSNLLVPFLAVILNMFLDYSFYDRTTLITNCSILVTGLADGMYLANGQYEGIFLDSLFGTYYTINYSQSIITKLAFWMIISLILVTICRFIYLSHHYLGKSVITPSQITTRKFINSLGIGSLLYIVLTILKRIYPYYLSGLDYFIMTILFSVIILNYFHQNEMFLFLPGTLVYGILVSKSGMHLMDYNFETREIIRSNGKINRLQDSNEFQKLLYGATVALKQAINLKLGSLNLDAILFEGFYIFNHLSENIHWYLISSRSFEIYSKLLQKIADEIEVSYSSALSHTSNVVEISEALMDKVKSEFDKLR